MVMDSLRYWSRPSTSTASASDLATTLGRAQRLRSQCAVSGGGAPGSVLAGVKLIAEPWMSGWAATRSAIFRPAGRKWNDRYRQTMRRYWGAREPHRRRQRAHDGLGRSFHHDRRSPLASINHVTVHDGFTLADLVSYAASTTRPMEKRTATAPTTTSDNCGHEGRPTIPRS